MQTRVLTNKIRQFHFDETQLNERFDFYRVKLPKNGTYAQKLSKVKHALSPLSSVYYNAETYYVMRSKGSDIKQDDDLAIKPISAGHLVGRHDVVLARLLLRAIPRLSTDDKCVDADGLYYLVKKDKFKQFDYFIGLNIDFRLATSPVFCNVVTIKAQTFTPFIMHNESKVSRYPRFDATLFKKLIKRTPKGEYVKRGIPKKKASVDMLDMNGEELSKFNLSKSGFLRLVQRDIQLVYGGAFTFELDDLESGYRIHRTRKFILDDYEKIYQYLQRQGVNVCNLSGELHLTNAVIEKVTELANVVPNTLKILNPNIPNLVLMNSPEYYEEFSVKDPYLSVKCVDPFSQIMTIDNLFLKGILNKEQVLASLKELVIKQEIKARKFFLKSLVGHWGFAYVTQTKRGEAFTYHYLEVMNGIMQYQAMTPVEWLEYSDVHFDIESKEQHLVIDYDDDYYVLITESELMAIPNYQEIHNQLFLLEKGRKAPIPLIAIQRYMSRIENSKYKIEQDLLQELDDVVTRNANKRDIRYEELYVLKKDAKTGEDKKKGIAYQGKKKDFYDFLRDEYSIYLKTSLKSKDGVLSSSLGLFYSPKSECYFVGSHEGAKSTINNFCKLRHIESDYQEIPTKLWNQFDAFYVRHKQSTVLPFAFKYLRECHKITQRQCNDT